MKAVIFLGDRRAVVQEKKDPEPKAGEVVVRMKASGICGSDMHKYRSTPEEIRKQGFSNLVIGHEPAGIVEKIGEGVENVRVGERVWVYHNVGCGYCSECLSGYHQLCKKLWLLGTNCDGSWSDFMLTRAVSCMKLPEQLSFVDGAIMACTGGTVFRAIERLGITAFDTVAIYGMGPLGLCGVLFARSMGARVLAVDLQDERLDFAKKMGASAVINASNSDPVESIRALTGEKGASVSIDFSGNASANAIRSLGFGGRGALIGFGRDMSEGFQLTTHDIIFKNLTIIGNLVFPIDACQRMMDFLLLHEISLEMIVTQKFRLEQAIDALKLFDSLKTGKVTFVW
jgi:propanol-preferring alcohol dehydrogenase